jgi:hypothetical protein
MAKKWIRFAALCAINTGFWWLRHHYHLPWGALAIVWGQTTIAYLIALWDL